MADPGDLEALTGWLQSHSCAVGSALAARAALRILPLADAWLRPIDAYHAVAVAWTFANFREPRDRARTAGAGVVARFERYLEAPHVFAVAYRCALLVANEEDAFDSFNGAAAHNIHDAIDCARHDRGARGDRGFAAAHESALASDLDAIDEGHGAGDLLARRLWPAEEEGTIEALWNDVKRGFLAANEGWEVWTDWYDARLRGDPAIEDLEIARISTPKRVWEKGANAENAEIRRVLASKLC